MDRRAFLAALGAGGALVGIGSPLAAAPLAKVKEAGVMRVALYVHNAPWSWADDGDVMRGLDADIASAIARKLGVGIELAGLIADETVDDDLRNAVWRGGLLGFRPCDAMMHVPFDRRFARRNDRVVIVAPYYREGFGMVCGGSVANCDAPLATFEGKRLAVELDTVPDHYLLGASGGVLRDGVKHYPTADAAVQSVLDGKTDAAVATKAQIEYTMLRARNSKNASADDTPPDFAPRVRKEGLPRIPSLGWDIAVAVKEDSRSLGNAIEEIMEQMRVSGELKDMFAGYGVNYALPVAVL